MIDEETKNEILRNIAISGDTFTQIKPIIASSDKGLNHILNFGSGLPRFQTNIKFALILSQPGSLTFYNPFEIRCCLCKRVISYPCWYYEVKYAVNHFHFFVCFDKNSKDKPSTKCYRRG